MYPTTPSPAGGIAGSSYTKAQKGSWGSQRTGKPSTALPPAAGYLGSGGRVPRQLPPNFVTAAVSQDTATLPARKGTLYPAETGQQFKWGNVITHTYIWP